MSAKRPTKKSKTEEQEAFGVGSEIPNVSVRDEEGTLVNVRDLDGLLVLFAYPRASTPGCTRHAEGFKAVYELFLREGVKVYGVSPDTEKRQMGFKKKYELPFHLLADADRVLLTALGAHRGGRILRSNWVFRNKRCIAVDYAVKPDVSPMLVLQALREASDQSEEEQPQEPSENEKTKNDESLEKNTHKDAAAHGGRMPGFQHEFDAKKKDKLDDVPQCSSPKENFED